MNTKAMTIDELKGELTAAERQKAEVTAQLKIPKITKKKKEEFQQLKANIELKIANLKLDIKESKNTGKTVEKSEDDDGNKQQLEQAALEKIEALFIKNPNIWMLTDEGQWGTIKWLVDKSTDDGTQIFEFHKAAPGAFRIAFDLEDDTEFTVFKTVLRERGSIRNKTVNTLRQAHPTELNENLFHHVKAQPLNEPHHAMFDYLLSALSGSREAEKLHIMQCIGWKYLHPDEMLMPALCWYGSGDNGKNLMVEQILGRIFGHNQTSVVNFEGITHFQDEIASKMIVMIDEAAEDKTDGNWLKQNIHSSSISINMKHGKKGKIDNFVWWILATNNYRGPIRLEGNQADRRYSIIKTPSSIAELVQADEIDPALKSLTLTEYKAHLKSSGFYKPAFDLTECSKFLASCIVAAIELKSAPTAWHGEDFKELLKIQQSSIDALFETIFKDTEFTHVSAQSLYDIYKEDLSLNNPSMRNKANGKNTFLTLARDYVSKHKLEIEFKERQHFSTTSGEVQRGMFKKVTYNPPRIVENYKEVLARFQGLVSQNKLQSITSELNKVAPINLLELRTSN